MSEAALRRGRADEAALLSDLALRSKGHWGYDAAFLDACRAELTLSPEQASQAVVAVHRGAVVGFHLLERETDPEVADTGRLGMLFVEPGTIGSGVGRLLLDDAVRRARDRGWQRLVLDADPGAEGFYLRMGARHVGEVPSGSVAGRTVAVLELSCGPTPSAREAR